MALDELHARRLATLLSLMESALDRIERALEGIERGGEAAAAARLGAEQARGMRRSTEHLRRRLREASERFQIRPRKPTARQSLGAELASLRVILENARPQRMKGYGREFHPADRADWEAMIQDLLREVERLQDALASPP